MKAKDVLFDESFGEETCCGGRAKAGKKTGIFGSEFVALEEAAVGADAVAVGADAVAVIEESGEAGAGEVAGSLERRLDDGVLISLGGKREAGLKEKAKPGRVLLCRRASLGWAWV
jgi:hypothetical protein